MPTFDATLLRAWDAWALSFLVLVVLPAYTYFGLYRPKGRAGGAGPSRLRLYAAISGPQWVLTGLLVGVARRHHLSLADLGLGIQHPWRLLAITLILVGLWLGLLRLGDRRSRRLPPERLAAQLAPTRFIVPTTPIETLGFLGLALTTGICEELLFRGWVVPFLAALGGSPFVGVVAAGLLFGAGHAHQGLKGVLQTGLVGVALGFGYWALGSLIPLQVLHLTMNFSQGVMAARLLAGLSADSSPTPSVPE